MNPERTKLSKRGLEKVKKMAGVKRRGMKVEIAEARRGERVRLNGKPERAAGERS